MAAPELSRRRLGILLGGAAAAIPVSAAAGFAAEQTRSPLYSTEGLKPKDFAALGERAADLERYINIPPTGKNTLQGAAGDTWQPEVSKTVVARAALTLALIEFGKNGVEVVANAIATRGVNVMWDDMTYAPTKEESNPIEIKVPAGMRLANVQLYGEEAKARKPEDADDFKLLDQINAEVVMKPAQDAQIHVGPQSGAGLIANLAAPVLLTAGAEINLATTHPSRRRMIGEGAAIGAAGLAATYGMQRNNAGGAALEKMNEWWGTGGSSLGEGYTKLAGPFKPFSGLITTNFRGKLIAPTQ